MMSIVSRLLRRRRPPQFTEASHRDAAAIAALHAASFQRGWGEDEFSRSFDQTAPSSRTAP